MSRIVYSCFLKSAQVKVYEDHLDTFKRQSQEFSETDRRISIYRFLLVVSAIILLYQYNETGYYLLLLPVALVAAAFFLLIQKHKAIRLQNELAKIKVAINEDELAYVKKGDLPFDDGNEFIDPTHDYSYDLDFFGSRSLFHHLNRTGTITGKRLLADSLLHILPKDQIIQNQESVNELKDEIAWRQDFLALAKLKPDSPEIVSDLIGWSKKRSTKFTGLQKLFSYLCPALVITTLVIYLFTPYELMGRLSLLLSLINLGVVGAQFKSIKGELITSTRIEQILRQYSLLFKQIEDTSFTSKQLKALQQQLLQNNHKASTSIHDLSLLFGRLEHVSNVFAAPLLNGLFLYHFHVLRGLSSWKRTYAEHIEEWLQIIGEFEKFSSLANFTYNNEGFVFPEINDNHEISFEELGHPLIQNKISVTNSISFQPQSFFILTGSNMSGKSTFLRTLGVNMVLAGIGAPVYATKASIYPLPVLVSMRLSDSLTDSESYFYAEVKRLKYIMDQLKEKPCFVLLDEILRGTNSDDKRNGTIEVIKKMANQKVYGGIATHDLEVCNVSNEYPKTLTNKRFEVEIVNDELVFDYKLRDGVCQNKSASFIMKKMDVI